jgi:cell wall assembly regulator SMI1
MKDSLENIDKSLEKNFKDVFESLRSGATDEEIELLKKCFTDQKIPEEIISLYKWHNGQDGSFSLNQNDNRSFLPISEVIDSWEFLNDTLEEIQEPILKSWLPILYNGAGDYIMYEIEGHNKGKLISFWHDDEGRDIEYENLDEWAKEVLNASNA